MDLRRLAIRASDIERILDESRSPVLGNHFRATLPTGRMVRFLVAIQGQDVISMPSVESLAHEEIGITPFELQKAYLPLFQEWGFVRIFEKKIEETVESRVKVLDKAGKHWQSSDPHPVEKLGVEIFDQAATAPRESDAIHKILDNYSSDHAKSAITHLKETALVDTLELKGEKWFYSPEIFGEKHENVVKYLGSRNEKEKKGIYEAIQRTDSDQGIPQTTLDQFSEEGMSEKLAGSGILMGHPLTIGDRSEVFFFTPDLRNRFDREGRGDKFELIQTGISHFQFAHRLASSSTGRLKFNPYVFLDKLIENGQAGNASAIGTDYDLLKKRGLVKIERVQGSFYRFVLPDSKEKVADLEMIRDSFKNKFVIPQIDLNSMGLHGKPTTGDSIVYRSRKFIRGKHLAEQFAKEVYLM